MASSCVHSTCYDKIKAGNGYSEAGKGHSVLQAVKKVGEQKSGSDGLGGAGVGRCPRATLHSRNQKSLP